MARYRRFKADIIKGIQTTITEKFSELIQDCQFKYLIFSHGRGGKIYAIWQNLEK